MAFYRLPSSAKVARDSEDAGKVVGFILGDTEVVWDAIFTSLGKTYHYPKLLLYRGGIFGELCDGVYRTGPFYCSFDNRIYLDLNFFSALRIYFARTAGATDVTSRGTAIPNRYAVLWAYAIAHETAHHVQTLFGIEKRVAALEEQLPQPLRDRLSTLFELQADCLAGIWFSHINKRASRLRPGDLDLALEAAAAVGADARAKQEGTIVMPDSFTHGTSEERAYWLKRGFETGDMGQCNTFDDRFYLPRLPSASPDSPNH